MNIETFDKHYVIFLSPGTLFNETSICEIESWDLKKAVTMSETIVERHGAKPFGFKFETCREALPQKDSRGDEVEIKPKSIAWSDGVMYLGGKVETYDEIVTRNDPKEEILRNNMRMNDWWLVITNTNSYRSTFPFKEDDVIVDANGEIIARGEDYADYCALKSAEKKAKQEK